MEIFIGCLIVSGFALWATGQAGKPNGTNFENMENYYKYLDEREKSDTMVVESEEDAKNFVIFLDVPAKSE